MTKKNDFFIFPDSQIAKSSKLNETKMKYTIQFGIAPHFRYLLTDDLNNILNSFKVDETKTKQAKKPYSCYTYCIKVWYDGTLMVDHCLAGQLLEHFIKFIRKANLDLRLMLYTGMDGPNANFKFEELLRSFKSLKHLI